MHPTFSVFLLLQKRSLKAVLPVLLILAVLEAAAFFLLTGGQRGQSAFWLEDLADSSHLLWLFCLGFLAVLVQLLHVGMDSASGVSCQSYTLCRLAIPQRDVFLCCCLAHLMTFLLLHAVQLTAALLLLMAAAAPDPSVCGGAQGVFLAFYRNGFLHTLFPGADLLCWLRMATLYLGTSVCTAACCLPLMEGPDSPEKKEKPEGTEESEEPAKTQRTLLGFTYRKSTLRMILLLAVLFLISAEQPLGSAFRNTWVSLIAIAMTAYILHRHLRKEDVEHEA